MIIINDSQNRVAVFSYENRLVRTLLPKETLELPFEGQPDFYDGRFDSIRYLTGGRVEVKESKNYRKPSGWTIDYINESSQSVQVYKKKDDYYKLFRYIPKFMSVDLMDDDIWFEKILFRDKQVVTYHPDNATSRHEFTESEIIKIKRSPADIEKIKKEILNLETGKTKTEAERRFEKI